HGIDVMKAVAGYAEVICCTGYNHYGKDLFDLDAAYYLIKPITVQQFDKGIDRVWKRKGDNLNSEPIVKSDLLDLHDYIMLRLENSNFLSLQLIEIECLESEGDSTYVTYTEGKIKVYSR